MATPGCYPDPFIHEGRVTIKANSTLPFKRLACFLCIAVFFASCATQKSRQDQSDFAKFYHNLTSKFNGYFNANELMEQSIATLEEQHTDNYNKILPVYEYRAATSPEAVSADLDEAIKKVSVVVTLHETSNWVDDCYLLIGKAEYLKQDFESAQNALEFFMDEFNPDGTRVNARPSKKDSKTKRTATKRTNNAKTERQKRREAKAAEKARKAYNRQVRKNRKKGRSQRTEPEKADSDDDKIVATKRNTSPEPDPPQEDESKPAAPESPGAFDHKPCYQEAQLWLAKTYVERENFPRAEYYFNSLKTSATLLDDVKRELPVAQAYYAIVRENYQGAMVHLADAIELANKKQDRARYAFILGQIAERENEPVKARKYYAMSGDIRSDYELEFNARLSMARTALLTGDANEAEVIRSLERMLKDDKNADYRDQIYFTLGKLAIQSGRIDDAIAHLQMAVEHGGTNKAQATESNYLLATLYFERGDYVEAKSAYDAALNTMDKADERYRSTERLSNNLTDIAKYLTQIELQDSLLRIAALSEEEQRELAKKLLENQQSTSKDNLAGNLPTPGGAKGKSPGQGAISPDQLGSNRPASPLGNTQSSSFFAYDDRAVRRGQREFEREWGDRPLADNWRLSSKIEGLSEIAVLEDTVETAIIISDLQVDRALEGVPQTPEELAQAHGIIQNAMLQLGSLYRDKLEEYQQSIDILEELLRKYPDTEKQLDAYYQLYLSYLSVNDIDKSNYYKEKIISEFAASKYALALSDPDYIKKQLTEEQQIDRYYQEVYGLVDNFKFAEAKELIDQAKLKFGTNHPMQPKFSILEAMCIGNLEGRDAYIGALKTVIGNYPNSPEEIKARDMLLQLGEYQGSRLNLAKNTNLSGPNFQMSPDAVHFVLVMIHNQGDEDSQIDMQDAKISISNYNRKYNKLDRLKISTLVYDPSTRKSLILVRSFKNSERAMNYYNNALKHSDEFLPPNADFEMYPVTTHNYREIIRQKSLESYAPFFEENYSDE